MKAAKSLASVVLFAVATLSGHAFASGYGPAPRYNPADGAPASQRGQSAQTLATESNAPSQGSIAAATDNGATSASGKEFASSTRRGSVAVQ